MTENNSGTTMGENKIEANIVRNGSKAYGYNYSNLADIAKAGIKIPKMRVKPMDGVEYIEYLDENNEWQLGARIVVPEMRGMNAAQAYGSALTYARRYTTQMAMSVACDDDSKLEAQGPSSQNRKSQSDRPKPILADTLDIAKFREEVMKMNSDEEVRHYYRVIINSYRLNVTKTKVIEEICREAVEKINKRKETIGSQ